MWKKKPKEKEQEGVKEVSLLQELSGDDVTLYDFLSHYLCVNPLMAISKKGLDILTEEGEQSGDYRPAVDKAIFEGSQNPGERERYIKVIRDLALKTIHATEQEKEKVEKEGLIARAAFLGSRIENHKYMSERAEDILNAASKFYSERLLELGENVGREERNGERKEAEREEWRIGQREHAERDARKKERSKMGRAERREAEKLDQREELATEARREARGEERRETEREDQRTEEMEKAGREARKKGRKGD